jgi:uncharacterized protein (TIGR02594 family)
MAELGVTETPGTAATPRILEYFKWCPSLPVGMATTDETSWCSALINFGLGTCKLKHTGSAAARSWERHGRALPRFVRGGIVVLSRGPDPKHGHVGISLNYGKQITLLGGNQTAKGCVSIESYPLWRVVAMRWPSDYTYPFPA